MPPKMPNGIITQYSILYGEVNKTNFGDNMQRDTIEGLSSNTVYVLQLRAHTSVGAGPPSHLTILTCKLFMLLHVIVICIVICIVYQY